MRFTAYTDSGPKNCGYQLGPVSEITATQARQMATEYVTSYINSARKLYCFYGEDQAPLCPPTGTPEWCPLERLEEQSCVK